jgi:cis-3-alkyl-4-acyloxetan-2-one decarboxylase
MMVHSREHFKQTYPNEYPFATKFHDHGDFVQHYIDEGDKDARPVVMLHGNPTWSFYYRNLAKTFSKDHRVIVPDHMGCGFSTKPQDGDYTLKNHIDHVENLLKHLDIDSFDLVVHDWGGAIGFGLAVRMPEKIKSIVILNTAAYPDVSIPKSIAFCRLPVVGEWMVRGLNAFAWPATFMTTEKPLTSELKKAYLYPYNNYKNRVAISRFVQDIPMEKDHPTYPTMSEIESKLPTLKCPKMIIWGGKDFCFNDSFYNRWKGFYPDAKDIYLKDAGHYVLEDAGEKVIEQMTEFYQTLN